jgi:F-type H+-transporting ATPase subunit b
MASTTHTRSIIEVGPKAQTHTKEYGLLTLDPGVGLWAVVAFAFLFVILKRFAWGPIIHSLDEREKRLQASLQAAEDARNESKKIAEQQKEIILKSRMEANEIISAAKQSAEDFKIKLERSAKAEKEKILLTAESEIKALKNAAIQELKKTTVELAIKTSEKIMQQQLDPKKSKELANQFISELEV